MAHDVAWQRPSLQTRIAPAQDGRGQSSGLLQLAAKAFLARMAARMRKIMAEKYGVVIAGGMGAISGSTFRIGSMGIVSKKEVKITVNALEKALLSLNYKLDIGKGIEAVEKVFG